MQTMGIDQNMQYEIFRLLSAILWLGNVQFTADEQDHAVIADRRTLEVRLTETQKTKHHAAYVTNHQSY